MNKIFSWTNNPTYGNKWDRMALTNRGAYIAAWVSVDDEKVFTSCVPNLLNRDMVTQTFATLEAAQTFADQELKRQGF